MPSCRRLPAMLQGIRGDAPETLGGMQMQNNNASGVLRRLAKRFDDYMTGPHIRRYYDWMMQHSENDAARGDFRVDVRASSALVERDAQQHFLMGLLSISANPAYGLNPYKLAQELLKGQRYDPRRVQYSPEEHAQQIASQQKTDSPADQAKVELNKAQTLKTIAEMAETNVNAMYGATNAANLIASNPAIAPVADKMLGTAGQVDHDKAPFIDPPAAGTPAEQGLPENTSPNFPPRLPSANAGLHAGIESGEVQQ